MDIRNIIKEGDGIQSIRIIEPKKADIKIVIEEILKSKINELNIDIHYDTITNLAGDLVELISSELEISFKFRKT